MREERHILLYSIITATEQTLIALDYEHERNQDFYVLPPELTGHAPDNRAFHPGLNEFSMFLSPAGDYLLTLYSGSQTKPQSLLHQVDLRSGEVLTTKLMDGRTWQIPFGPGRRPIENYEGRAVQYYELGIYLMQLVPELIWSPDGQGFIFTIGEYADRGQLYYVERGSTQVTPLALNAPGVDIGFEATWSPDGEWILYTRNPKSAETIWRIDLRKPQQAEQISGRLIYHERAWLPEGHSIIYTSRLEEDLWDIIKIVDVESGEGYYITKNDEIPEGYTNRELIGNTADGLGFVITEEHEIDDLPDPSQQKLLYLDLATDELRTVLEGEAFSRAWMLPVEDWVWLLYDESGEAEIRHASTGEIVYPRSAHIYPPPEEAFHASTPYPLFSPDMHLLAGYSPDDETQIVIWDMLTREFIPVAPEVEGEQVLLGWVQDPEAWLETMGLAETKP